MIKKDPQWVLFNRQWLNRECFTYGDDDLIFSSEVSLMENDVTDQVKINNKKLTR